MAKPRIGIERARSKSSTGTGVKRTLDPKNIFHPEKLLRSDKFPLMMQLCASCVGRVVKQGISRGSTGSRDELKLGKIIMKKLALSIALLGASSLLSPGIAGTSVTKFNASLDGFCDVFNLKLAGFLVYGKRSGCDSNIVDGGSVAQIDSTTWIISNDQNHGDKKHVFSWYFTPPVNGAGSWYLYVSDGKSSVELNTGTYSKPAAAKSGEKSATYGRN